MSNAMPLGVFLLSFRDIARIGDHNVLVAFLGAGVGRQPAQREAAPGAYLVEETPRYLARRAREGQPRDDTTAEVYARGELSPPIAPTDDAAKRAE